MYKYLLVSGLLLACSSAKNNQDYTQYVNPLIGTAPATTLSAEAHGHGSENNAQVIPEVTYPFGMTNWTAQTYADETKCKAPYYYTDSLIQGFRGSHWLSGSCVQDYGSMTIMPISGELKWGAEERASRFSHNEERASAEKYSVHLADHDIDVEMTATLRTGLLRVKFNRTGAAHFIVQPNSDEGQGFVEINAEKNEIVGFNPVHRIYQGWGEEAGFKGYFVAQFSRSFSASGTFSEQSVFENENRVSDKANLGAYLSFDAENGEVVEVRIGTSFTSIEAARKNLEAETADLRFDEAVENLKSEWNRLLGSVEVNGGSEKDKVKFYTAMYHSFLQPRLYTDVEGTYPKFGGSGEMGRMEGNYYDDFSMWDTYRASLPLFTLLKPESDADMMKSILLKAEQGGWLPIFPCWNSYTSAMIGDHAVPALADAYGKGLIEISDKDYAYLLKNAFELPETEEEYKQGKGRRALDSYIEYGYIPLEDEVMDSFHKREQVSRTLEYAFDDFALAQIAQKKGDEINAEKLRQRALNYRNVFSPADSTVRGKYADGHFTEEYDKLSRQSYITEGTPYQYTWYVPQDMAGLMQAMGGQEAFNANLDRFHALGQYWHGNEPGHQIPFLYNFSGEPWKTQALVGEIMKNEYDDTVGGLSGNDDAGQMSAWYVFAAMGFYPVTPSVPEYVISGPRFDEVKMHFPNGKTLQIKAKGVSEGRHYIASMRINGEKVSRNYLKHEELIAGGEIEFEMSKEPNKEWGTASKDWPHSLSQN
ncbi:GH92 family glycosyl hydrolase [Marinilongibacter aquaticus]|uniref:GH92 family glycosyl hydrolase n=1 Tax=Marinilongibacter aquaticus TaxID=2975157 RepID=UPI0021BCFBA6|nr:GH92 family glycosyl hydrolase [Marinilongibacter aquaticus]UBM60109.1 GH92 family glycosyl hydrolase [Marinilongibacter aquaticus]